MHVTILWQRWKPVFDALKLLQCDSMQQCEEAIIMMAMTIYIIYRLSPPSVESTTVGMGWVEGSSMVSAMGVNGRARFLLPCWERACCFEMLSEISSSAAPIFPLYRIWSSVLNVLQEAALPISVSAEHYVLYSDAWPAE